MTTKFSNIEILSVKPGTNTSFKVVIDNQKKIIN